MLIPVGTTGQQPTCNAALAGAIRFNSTTSTPEYCSASAWVPFDFVPYYSVQTAASISVGTYTVCGVKSTGALYCWGYNFYDNTGNVNQTDQKVPVAAAAAFAGPWSSISNGYYTTCGITTGNSAYCWGYNGTGQFGNGTTTNNITAPVQISGAWIQIATGGSPASTLTNNPAAAYVTCGVKSGNSGWCWGGNANGEVGDGTTTQRNSPVQITGSWSGIWPSRYGLHTCGITTAGALYCWGYGQYGQLGQGNTSDSSSPVQITGTWSSVSVGGLHTCAINTSNALYCWGYNGFGQLGDGTTTQRNSPVQISGTWAKVSAGSLNGAHTCGLTTGGAAYCWGYNVLGQLGINSMAETATSPTVLATQANVTGTSWTDLEAGLNMTCGLRDDSTIYCWGQNSYGRLGDPNFSNYVTPVSGN